jgi:uncharacterized protein YbaP (TraB family)
MKHTLIACCSLFIVLSASFAQNTILWRISKQGSNNTSYLLGTYHLFGSSFVDRFPVIQQSLAATNLVITETKTDAAKARSYYNARPGSDSLFTVLSASDSEQLMKLFPRNEKSIDLRKFTPGELFVKMQAIYPRIKCDVPGKNDSLLMDNYIQFLAAGAAKGQYFLETDSLQAEKLREATNAYDWLFFKRNAPAILADLKNNRSDKNLCMLARQYADLSLNYQLKTSCELFKDKMTNQALLENRNKEWMQKLPALLDNNNCFIAVGLGHLFNQCGLVQSLRERGFIVEPVSMEERR